MFRCNYKLNDECQLYSCKCKKENCALYMKCCDCNYGILPESCEACANCLSRENKVVQ